MTKLVVNELKPKKRPFKIGDRVKVVKYPDSDYIGKIGYIKDVFDDIYWPYDVNLEDEDWRSPMSHNEIELVEEPKFKVGDRVVVIDAEDTNYKVGDIGHIVKKEFDGLVDVECDGYRYWQYFRPEQLEHYVEQPKEDPLKKAWEAYESEDTGVINQLSVTAEWEEQEKPKYLQPSRALDSQVGGSHYKDLPIQPVEFILSNGLGFCEGSIIKYTCRYRQKGGIEDLKKVIHYAQLLIENLEKETN